MRLAVTIGIAALICAAGAAGAQTAAPPPAATLTPVQIVAARKAAFDLSQNTFGGLNAQAQAATPDWRGLGFGAAALSRWAHALPTLFVAGTSAADLPGGTAAKPEIWTARADFEAKGAAYAAAADKLGELATAQDIEGYKTQLAAVNETCRSCHMVYRARPAG